ncbi:uncharacterized protein LOC135689116 [Rhopilema esculentum]|uniref:uncharacterized protein LOC135689116 n=1 Tax=Rhopilema esculentum TaxID=499914 RepID=UPI0031D1E0D7|eukprot:gene2992-1251_t
MPIPNFVSLADRSIPEDTKALRLCFQVNSEENGQHLNENSVYKLKEVSLVYERPQEIRFGTKKAQNLGTQEARIIFQSPEERGISDSPNGFYRSTPKSQTLEETALKQRTYNGNHEDKFGSFLGNNSMANGTTASAMCTTKRSFPSTVTKKYKHLDGNLQKLLKHLKRLHEVKQECRNSLNQSISENTRKIFESKYFAVVEELVATETKLYNLGYGEYVTNLKSRSRGHNQSTRCYESSIELDASQNGISENFPNSFAFDYRTQQINFDDRNIKTRENQLLRTNEKISKKREREAETLFPIDKIRDKRSLVRQGFYPQRQKEFRTIADLRYSSTKKLGSGQTEKAKTSLSLLKDDNNNSQHSKHNYVDAQTRQVLLKYNKKETGKHIQQASSKEAFNREELVEEAMKLHRMYQNLAKIKQLARQKLANDIKEKHDRDRVENQYFETQLEMEKLSFKFKLLAKKLGIEWKQLFKIMKVNENEDDLQSLSSKNDFESQSQPQTLKYSKLSSENESNSDFGHYHRLRTNKHGEISWGKSSVDQLSDATESDSVSLRMSGLKDDLSKYRELEFISRGVQTSEIDIKTNFDSNGINNKENKEKQKENKFFGTAERHQSNESRLRNSMEPSIENWIKDMSNERSEANNIADEEQKTSNTDMEVIRKKRLDYFNTKTLTEEQQVVEEDIEVVAKSHDQLALNDTFNDLMFRENQSEDYEMEKQGEIDSISLTSSNSRLLLPKIPMTQGETSDEELLQFQENVKARLLTKKPVLYDVSDFSSQDSNDVLSDGVHSFLPTRSYFFEDKSECDSDIKYNLYDVSDVEMNATRTDASNTFFKDDAESITSKNGSTDDIENGATGYSVTRFSSDYSSRIENIRKMLQRKDPTEIENKVTHSSKDVEKDDDKGFKAPKDKDREAKRDMYEKEARMQHLKEVLQIKASLELGGKSIHTEDQERHVHMKGQSNINGGGVVRTTDYDPKMSDYVSRIKNIREILQRKVSGEKVRKDTVFEETKNSGENKEANKSNEDGFARRYSNEDITEAENKSKALLQSMLDDLDQLHRIDTEAKLMDYESPDQSEDSQSFDDVTKDGSVRLFASDDKVNETFVTQNEVAEDEACISIEEPASEINQLSENKHSLEDETVATSNAKTNVSENNGNNLEDSELLEETIEETPSVPADGDDTQDSKTEDIDSENEDPPKLDLPSLKILFEARQI